MVTRAEMLRLLKEGKDPLDLSIQKWQDIVDGKGKDTGRMDCALCELYFDDGCYDCPIQRKTKETNCHGTPYEIFKLHDRAQKELEFLKKLREELQK